MLSKDNYVGGELDNKPLHADSKPVSKLERDVELGTLWDLVESHLGQEVVDSADRDRLRKYPNCIVFIFTRVIRK
jgi:hypothetical protein